jgi:hypothetical protein
MERGGSGKGRGRAGEPFVSPVPVSVPLPVPDGVRNFARAWSETGTESEAGAETETGTEAEADPASLSACGFAEWAPPSLRRDKSGRGTA